MGRRATVLRIGGVMGGAALAGAMALLAASHSQQPTPTAPVAAAPPPGADMVERGRYLVTAGDCDSCHSPPGGAPFAGGSPLQTPFGTVLSANITSGTVGRWTSDQFYRALHEGIGGRGGRLYPAFPYVYYTRVTRPDSDAILAYLKTTAPVHNKLDRDQLRFPFNIRHLMIGWNWLFFREGELKPDPGRSAEWNRGAYLVEGLGHCGACHTPKNTFGADRQAARYEGGVLDGWLAPDITGNTRIGLGAWSKAEVVEFLKTGRNARSSATGRMAQVITNSTSKLTDADLNAMAAYLKSLPASRPPAPRAPQPAVMRAGEAIFVDQCSACHRMDGRAQPGFFPPLPGNANVQQRNPTTVLRIILNGAPAAATDARPTPLAMPAFGWKLDDAEAAAVATYVRNSWGNAAEPVSAAQAAKVRKSSPPATRPS